MPRSMQSLLAKITVAVLLLSISSACPTPAEPVLKGRIEEIVYRGTKLPKEIALQKMVPRLDTRKPFDLLIGTTVPSYPDYLIGTWGGRLKTTWVAQQRPCSGSSRGC